ncbi:MAG: beta-lactamase family protein [Candidatus Zixiibacteriota bacterium]|nr:MAG: beta-lactamase family protein [candidate division Zixibacteria bacterium]
MKLIKVQLSSVALFCLLFSASCSTWQGQKTGETVVAGDVAERVDAYLAGITSFGFSGAALVARGDEILLNKGYSLAVAADSIPNTAQTVFSVGSITKQFTAAAIMKLEMTGKLAVSDRITKYFDNVPPDKQVITLHHLLTHTAGLPGSLGRDFEVVGRDEMMRRILNAPLEFPPGRQFGYSNCGYSMLAAVVEIASAQPYEQFLAENLFEPAGMHFTGYRRPDWSRRTVARWYTGEADNGTPLEKDYPYWNYIGNGGILSTTGDMFRWHRALLGEEILSAAAKQKLYTPFLNDYAYGWDVLETERGVLIQHDGGSSLGCAADFKRFIDSGIVIMLFSNYSGPDILMEKGVRDRVTDLVFGVSIELPLDVSDDPIDASAYAGSYLLDEDAAFNVTNVSNALVVTPFGAGAVAALYFPDTSQLAQIDSNQARSEGVLSAAAKGDFEPFRALINDDGRLERIRQLWNMRVERYAEMTGPLTGAVARYSLPSGFQKGAVETLVEITGERSGFFYRMIWKDGRMIGIAPTMPPSLGGLVFRHSGEGRFFTYNISAARNIRLTFDSKDMVILGGNSSLRVPKIQ